MSELSQLNTAVLFTNWTNEDFAHTWGGQLFTFPKRSSEWISVGTREHNQGLAQFFTKHLTDRELNKANVPTDHFSRSEFESNCFLTLEETHAVPVMKVEIHAETGLVKSVIKVGTANPRTGETTKVDAPVVIEEPVVEKTPEPLGAVVEAAKKPVKKEKAADTKDTFEE